MSLKRKNKVSFRLDDSELSVLKKCVAKSGYSQEAYIRSLLRGHIPREAPSLDYHSMIKQLRAIGNRMNQIAARANALGFIDAEEYKRDAQVLWSALLEIQSAFLPERINHGNNRNMED